MTISSVKQHLQREVTRARGIEDPAARAHEVIALERQCRNAQLRLAMVKRQAYHELVDDYSWSTIDLGREFGHSRQRASKLLLKDVVAGETEAT